MLASHCRNRSLITVKDLEKYDVRGTTAAVLADNDDEHQTNQPITSRQHRNLVMIYLLFLAEAVMAASLSSQIGLLLPSAFACLSPNSTFLRSILQCAYFLGSATGVFWGFAADQLGRKPVALIGLFGMSMCCISMGFATRFVTLAFLRYVAGAISSAVTVAGLAMLADVTHGSRSRVQLVARLPIVVACGQLGPVLATSVQRYLEDHHSGVLARFPAFGGQMVCAALVIIITIAEALLLEETVPDVDAIVDSNGQIATYNDTNEHDASSEKTAFLDRVHSYNHHDTGDESDDESSSLNISITMDDAPRTWHSRRRSSSGSTTSSLPSHISLGQMLTAPSILLLLLSFSTLNLHSAVFEVALPQLAQPPSGTDTPRFIPCTVLSAIMLAVQVLAGCRIMSLIPRLVSRIGVLPLYRRISTVFPVLYLTIPLLAATLHWATLTTNHSLPSLLASILTLIALLLKTLLANSATILVYLLTFTAAPDASCSATLIGVVSIAHLARAFATGLAGLAAFSLSSIDLLAFLPESLRSRALVSALALAGPWLALACLALVAAAVTIRLRATPRVGADFDESSFVWEGVWDAEEWKHGKEEVGGGVV